MCYDINKSAADRFIGCNCKFWFVSLDQCYTVLMSVYMILLLIFIGIFLFELIDVEYMLVNKTDTANMTGQCRHICVYIVASVD